MPSTTYLSFTSEGGRIGRIAWSNGDEETWGHVHWDRWWPYQRPTPTQLAKDAGFRWNEPVPRAWSRRLSEREIAALPFPVDPV